MEVRGVPSPFEIDDSKASLQRSLSAIPSVPAPSGDDEPVKLSVSPASLGGSHAEVGRINRAIGVTHALSEAVDSMGGLIDGIGEIVSRAARPGTSREDRKRFEAQANELAGGVRKMMDALETRVADVSGTSHDEIRNEIEQELGKALDLLFPPERSGLSFEIRLSQKESILNTIATVARARQRIEELRSIVREENKKLEESVSSSSEVATANSAATEASVRDIEDASALAENTSMRIGRNPAAAVQSAKNLAVSAANLLS